MRRELTEEEQAAKMIPALSFGSTFRATPTGLLVGGSPVSYEDWTTYGNALQLVDHATPWLLGDWLNYGERAYGETYTQAIQATGLGVQTLMDYKWVAARCQLSTRREALTFTHHSMVAKLDSNDQERWLTLAEQGNWSTRELHERLQNAGKIEGGREATAEAKAKKKAAEPESSPEDLLSIMTTISSMILRGFYHFEEADMHDPIIKRGLQEMRQLTDQMLDRLTEPFGDKDQDDEDEEDEEDEQEEEEEHEQGPDDESDDPGPDIGPFPGGPQSEDEA